MNSEWDAISAAEQDRLQQLYGPLAQAIRHLMDASMCTGADEVTLRTAQSAIEAVTANLQVTEPLHLRRLRDADSGRALLLTNPAVGWRNPVAPPMNVCHESDGSCWSEFSLGAVYEGPPGLVHGGICALVLDHILGEVASGGMIKPAFTGTLTLKYLRGTPLGPLRADAHVERIEGFKTYARGHLGDVHGPTVEAEGVFIMPAWARDGGHPRSDAGVPTK